MPEFWLVLAAVLLGVAALARVFALFGTWIRWKQVAVWARVGAVIMLLAALIWVADSTWILQGQWLASPALVPVYDFWQMTVGLALATLVTYLVLVWWLRSDAGSPIVDLIVLGLVLAGLLWRRPAGTVPFCAPCLLPVQVQWVLFLLGVGGIVVAGGAGLTLAARAASAGRARALGWAPWADVHVLLKQATAWALVALGGGLTLSIWWTWRTLGSLPSENAPVDWLAVAWLVAGMSMLARRTGNMGLRWTAGLAVVAAMVAVPGLLA